MRRTLAHRPWRQPTVSSPTQTESNVGPRTRRTEHSAGCLWLLENSAILANHSGSSLYRRPAMTEPFWLKPLPPTPFDRTILVQASAADPFRPNPFWLQRFARRLNLTHHLSQTLSAQAISFQAIFSPDFLAQEIFAQVILARARSCGPIYLSSQLV